MYRIPPKHLSSNYSHILKSIKVEFHHNEYETVFASGIHATHNEYPIYIIQKSIYHHYKINKILLGYLPTIAVSIIASYGEFTKEANEIIKSRTPNYHTDTQQQHSIPAPDILPSSEIIYEYRISENGTIYGSCLYVDNGIVYLLQYRPTREGRLEPCVIVCGEGTVTIEAFRTMGRFLTILSHLHHSPSPSYTFNIPSGIFTSSSSIGTINYSN